MCHVAYFKAPWIYTVPLLELVRLQFTILTIVRMRVPIHKFNLDILADMAMKPEHLGADH
jgi:hypothetical protein